MILAFGHDDSCVKELDYNNYTQKIKVKLNNYEVKEMMHLCNKVEPAHQ